LWCDLSWNSLGRSPDRIAVRTLSRSLKKNKVLTHLDISMNRFDLDDIKQLSIGLKTNRTLIGLHCLGNEGTVDCRGFLRPKKKPMHTQLMHLPNRCVPLKHQHSSPARKGSGCWLCGQWKPIEFIYTIGRSEGFKLVRRQLGVLREMFHHHATTGTTDGMDTDEDEDAPSKPKVDDFISKKKLKLCIDFLHIDMSDEELFDIANLMDLDGSGEIEFGELVSIVSRCLYLQTSSSSGGAAPSEILLVTDFGGTYVNEEPIVMTYDSSTRTFRTTIMCPPTLVHYHFVVERTDAKCAADQPMQAPGPLSTECYNNRWKLKKHPPSFDEAVFPTDEMLALRNYLRVGKMTPENHVKPMKPREMRAVLKKPTKKTSSKQGDWTLNTSVFKGWKGKKILLLDA